MSTHESDAFTTFMVNRTIAVEGEKDLRLRHDALSTRIEDIISKVVIEGAPVCRIILSITRKPEDLVVISKALQRLAELLPQHAELDRQLNAVDLFINDPATMARLIGDFGPDITQYLEQL